MGTWGAGIFDDDISLDVQAEYEEAIEDGLSVKKATNLILEIYEDVLSDDDEGPMVFLALAAIQLEKGHIQEKIKEKALNIIESEAGLERWNSLEKDELNKRKEVLNDLRNKLINR
jgi:hypothetical protein